MGRTERGERRIVDPNAYMIDCFRLAKEIWADDYRPDFLVALWHGGAPPGVVIQEFFRWKGHDPYHTPVRTRSLEGARSAGGFDIAGLERVLDVVQSGDRLLLVDDYLDTGRTISEVAGYLRREAGENEPEIRVAAVYFRSGRTEPVADPDYYLHEVDEPPLLPDRLSELTEDAARSLDPELHEALYG